MKKGQSKLLFFYADRSELNILVEKYIRNKIGENVAIKAV